MQALSGNSNDTKAFAQTVRRHLSSLKAAQECRYLVGDAVPVLRRYLLLAQQQQLFVTRVPVPNEEKAGRGKYGCKTLTALGNGYHGRWQHAICRGRATGAQRTSQPPRAADIGQNLLKDSTRELKAFAKLCARRFVRRMPN